MSRKEFITEAIKEAEKKLEPFRDKAGERKMRKNILNYHKEVEQGIPQYMEEQKIKLLPRELIED